MDKLILIYILVVLFSYIKLFYEKNNYKIGKMSIIITTMYYAIFSLIIAIVKHLNLDTIYNLLIVIATSIISIFMIIYSFLSIVTDKKKNRKRLIFNFGIILANIVAIMYIINT